MGEDTILILGIVTILGISGALVGMKWAKYQHLDPKIVQKRINLSDTLIADYEQEVKYWRGKANSSKQINKVEFDGDMSDEKQMVELIKELLPNIGYALPKELQPFIRDPAAVDLAYKLYQAHPEKFKQFVSGLIKKKGSDGQSTSSGNFADYEKQVIG